MKITGFWRPASTPKAPLEGLGATGKRHQREEVHSDAHASEVSGAGWVSLSMHEDGPFRERALHVQTHSLYIEATQDALFASHLLPGCMKCPWRLLASLSTARVRPPDDVVGS